MPLWYDIIIIIIFLMSSAKTQGDEKIKQVSLNKDSSSSSSSSLSPVCARKESESFPSSLLHRSVWPLKVEYTHNPISHFVQSNSIAAVDSFPFPCSLFFQFRNLNSFFYFSYSIKLWTWKFILVDACARLNCPSTPSPIARLFSTFLSRRFIQYQVTCVYTVLYV